MYIVFLCTRGSLKLNGNSGYPCQNSKFMIHGIFIVIVLSCRFPSGLVPTLVQIFPHAGLQFGFYAFFKTTWEMSFGIKVYISDYIAPQTMNAIILILPLVSFKVNDYVMDYPHTRPVTYYRKSSYKWEKCIFNLYFSSI